MIPPVAVGITLFDDLDRPLGTIPLGATGLCLEIGRKIPFDEDRRIADVVAAENFGRSNGTHLVALTTALNHADFHVLDPSAAPRTCSHNARRASGVSARRVEPRRWIDRRSRSHQNPPDPRSAAGPAARYEMVSAP